ILIPELLSFPTRRSSDLQDCVRFRDAIEQGKLVLINLGKNLFATDKAREVTGILLLSAFLRAVFSRPMNHGPYILTFMDEFQNRSEEHTSELQSRFDSVC